jgi:hypothetical protein
MDIFDASLEMLRMFRLDEREPTSGNTIFDAVVVPFDLWKTIKFLLSKG